MLHVYNDKRMIFMIAIIYNMWNLLVQTSPCGVMFAINTTTTQHRVCFNLKRFGLKHTLRCVIWVKLEALIWAGSGVKHKTMTMFSMSMMIVIQLKRIMVKVLP